MTRYRTILHLITHPVSIIATNLGIMGLLSYGSPNPLIHEMAQIMAMLALAALGQAFLTPSIFELKASPTNFGYCTAIGMLAISFAASSTYENPPFMSATGYLYASAVTFALLLFEATTRFMFMLNIWTMGEEEYARHKVERILSSPLCIWQERIKYIVDVSKGRSVVHDRYAKLVETEGRRTTPVFS